MRVGGAAAACLPSANACMHEELQAPVKGIFGLDVKV
jgi:hypothetical protein